MKCNFYEKKPDGKVHCLLCPNDCKLTDGQFGICRTRKCEGNELINPYSGILSSTGIDPMEKKPLYHFYPGTTIYSVGFFGCTLQCGFCQNYSISQYHPDNKTDKISPQQMLQILKKNGISSIAFTYSEPTLYYEWVMETAALCKENNIKTVLVTNGYLNPAPAQKLFTVIDACNIDLKSSKNEFYKKICKGKLEPVKEFIKLAFQNHVHIELTTLVITNTNDTKEEMKEIINFIASLSPDIPFHISRYHPIYNFNEPPTSVHILNNHIEAARKKLNYVYGGNMPGYSDTYCKECGTMLISRNYYQTEILKLSPDSACVKCGTKNPIVL